MEIENTKNNSDMTTFLKDIEEVPFLKFVWT